MNTRRNKPEHTKIICFLVAVWLFLGLSSCTSNAVTEEAAFQNFQSESQTVHDTGNENLYILNTKSKKIHNPTCGSASLMLSENRQEFQGETSHLLDAGYTFCGNCFR